MDFARNLTEHMGKLIQFYMKGGQYANAAFESMMENDERGHGELHDAQPGGVDAVGVEETKYIESSWESKGDECYPVWQHQQAVHHKSREQPFEETVDRSI